MLEHGCVLGWVSSALPKLASSDTPLTMPLSNSEISWIGSINCIGSLFGCFFFGYYINLIGSKRTIISLAVPSVVFWMLIYFGNHYYYILIARFLGGFTGGGIQTAILLYVSDIANDEFRGRLLGVTLLALNVGTLFAYILGAFIDYENIPIIFGSIPIIFAIIFVMFPNTPRYYLQRSKVHVSKAFLLN